MKQIYLYLLISLFLFGIAACNEDQAALVAPSSATVEFETNRFYFSEEIDTANIMLLLSVHSASEIEVDLLVTSGTAIEGVNFEFPSTKIIIPGGASSVQVPIIIYNDTIVSSSKTFSLGIKSIKGAMPSGLSQEAKVFIDNDDFLPKIKFLNQTYRVFEGEQGVYLSYVAEGIFYNSMVLGLKLGDKTAIFEEHYDLPDLNNLPVLSPLLDSINRELKTVYLSIDTATVDSIFIPLKSVELSKNISFAANWEIISLGELGSPQNTNIIIEDRKVASFARKDLMFFNLDENVNGERKVEVPIQFAGVSAMGSSATVNVSGLNKSDYRWEIMPISATKDEVVNAVLFINESVVITEPVKFSIAGDPDAGVVSVKNAVNQAKVGVWSIHSVSCNPYHPVNTQVGYLIDNSLNIRWQSAKDQTPVTIIVDMKSNVAINSVQLYIRTDGKDSYVKTADISFSLDAKEWSKPVEMNFKTGKVELADSYRTIFMSEWIQGRYMKIITTDTQNSALAEVNVRGVKIIEEIVD